MMWLVKLLQKKPKDSTIRIFRIVFSLLYIFLLVNVFFLNKWQIETILFFWLIKLPNTQLYLNIYHYTLIGFWIFPLLMWLFNISFLKSKYLRITQIIFWIFLFYLANLLPTSAWLNEANGIALMWIFPILAWITWKLITTKWKKFKEKIQKIRV